jgi:hypothetical protein
MPTTLGAVARHPVGQLEGVDDAAGVAGAVDDTSEDLSDEPDDFSDDADDFSDEEPLVADPAVTDEPERESVR